MEKLIDGKLYDTEEATEVAEYWNGQPVNDFDHMEETLYRTDSGRWFIHGDGGAKTKYRKIVGNLATGSSDLRALSDEEAFAWLQRHNMVEEAQEHFPDRIEPA